MIQIKLLVIGNCQARPLLSLLENIPVVQGLPPVILHLAKTSEEEAHLAAMAEADIILAQSTSDSFRVPHLCSGNIKAIRPDTLVWPNVFYSGQQPFLRYFTHPEQGRMMGPLEALHDIRLFAQWGRDRGVFHCDRIDEPFFTTQVQQISLQLRKREYECDVRIADFIHRKLNSDRLFYTFNHPTRFVLTELAARLAKQLGLEIDIALGTESLNRYIVPSLWPGESGDAAVNGYQGDDYELCEGGAVRRMPGRPKKYSASELVEAFYEVYDHNMAFHHPDLIRFTPNFEFDPKYITGQPSSIASHGNRIVL